jgi:hypothetical protein
MSESLLEKCVVYHSSERTKANNAFRVPMNQVQSDVIVLKIEYKLSQSAPTKIIYI